MDDGKMRLRAEDDDDLLILSTQVQDMVVTSGDIAYLAKARRFVVMGQRFRWELSDHPPSRVRAAIRVDGVLSVKAKGFDPTSQSEILNLLSIQATASDTGHIIDFLFSEAKSIRLEAEAIDLWLDDTGAAYDVRSRPDHTVEGE